MEDVGQNGMGTSSLQSDVATGSSRRREVTASDDRGTEVRDGGGSAGSSTNFSDYSRHQGYRVKGMQLFLSLPLILSPLFPHPPTHPLAVSLSYR